MFQQIFTNVNKLVYKEIYIYRKSSIALSMTAHKHAFKLKVYSLFSLKFQRGLKAVIMYKT